MRLQNLHPWEVPPSEAQEIQRQLAPKVSRVNALTGEPRWVAGVDLSAEDAQGYARAAVVVLRYPDLEVAEVRAHRDKISFPYIPGLLSFRETPLMAGALEKLELTPDLLFVDGQGLAHPRRFGIACHIGLLADCPTIGCAKSILRGRHGPIASHQGAWAELVDRDEVVGAVVRTVANVSPIYVSIGHRLDLEGAVRWVLACVRGYRLPEPTRLAHQAAAGRLEEGLRLEPPPRPSQQPRQLSLL